MLKSLRSLLARPKEEEEVIEPIEPTEKGLEYFVICRRCRKKYERETPRRPQDDLFFLCSNCQSELDHLFLHGGG